MDYRVTDEDKERIKLLNEVTKNKFKSLSLEQLVRLQKLLEKKDYSNQKKAEKAKEQSEAEAAMSKEEVQKLRQEQAEKRKRNKKKMTAKTKRGQPVMKHQIGYLLHKIKNS